MKSHDPNNFYTTSTSKCKLEPLSNTTSLLKINISLKLKYLESISKQDFDKSVHSSKIVMRPVLVNDKDPKENPKSECIRDSNICIEK
jgi:hypothetical protein